MINKITQKVLGYSAATALCLGGAGYFAKIAVDQPSPLAGIATINAVQNSLETSALKDKSFQQAWDENKTRIEEIKQTHELGREIGALEKSILQMPSDLKDSMEDEDYNVLNNYAQEQLGKIRETYQTEKGRYAGAAVALGVLASSLAALGHLDISNEKRKEKERKEFLSKIHKLKYERNIKPVVFRNYKSDN